MAAERRGGRGDRAHHQRRGALGILPGCPWENRRLTFPVVRGYHRGIARKESGMQVKGRHVQGILFDADGTLIDTYGTILASMRHAVGEALGLQLPDAELMGLVGTPLSDLQAP